MGKTSVQITKQQTKKDFSSVYFRLHILWGPTVAQWFFFFKFTIYCSDIRIIHVR